VKPGAIGLYEEALGLSEATVTPIR